MIDYQTILVFGDKRDRVIETVGVLPSGQAFELGYYNGDDKKKGIVNISPATGCPVGCNFCELGDAGGPLPAGLMARQVRDMVEFARELDGYDPARQPLKINIAKTGDPVFNPHMIEAFELILQDFPGTSFKFSTSMPDVPVLMPRIRELAQFAARHKTGSTQLQISLISTNEEYRQNSVGTRARLRLASIEKIREAVEEWHRINPFGRAPNCSLLVGAETPCDPQEILNKLPPGLARFRIRKIVETEHSRRSGLHEAGPERIQDIMARFRAHGYIINDAGVPTPTEARHSLASNVTRHRFLRGDFPPGVWQVRGDGGLEKTAPPENGIKFSAPGL